MTRDEIKLVAFVLLALLIGSGVKWWRNRPDGPPPVTPAPAPGGWAKPPYVFKSKGELDQTHQEAAKPISQEIR